MPALNQIALLINTALQNGHFAPQRFNPSRFLGIADPMRRVEEGGKEITTPTIIDNDGDGTEVVMNDKYSAQCYHRVVTPTYLLPPDNAYGKAGRDMQEIADCVMVFMGDRSQMKVTQVDCIAAVAYDFPKEFLPSQYSPLGLTSCVIEMGSVEKNPFDVFNTEWQGHDYALETSSILFSINYRVISTYATCFAICP